LSSTTELGPGRLDPGAAGRAEAQVDRLVQDVDAVAVGQQELGGVVR
jgi:hypothetical protein